MSKKQPWYLKKGSLYFFCIVAPPIGYIILISNLKKFEYNERIQYLILATIMASIWILKFLPKNISLYFWCLVLAIIIGSSIIKFIDKKKK
ncbi:hypothetical protein MXL46_19120 [Heyndrickxia sporothermodurans]|uniref:hypothetical protein n=1 Tax=Heyndrickxia sporothermodurans TaxID=46224 RepID=UPI002DB5B1D2|nr:hypothetical protein [Heyndrickxia sporothermodurans]MEB6551160.1 hypothetical protein [Heyndrickxia sporothermodurans]